MSSSSSEPSANVEGLVSISVESWAVPPLPETFEARFDHLKLLVTKALMSMLNEVKKRDELSRLHPDKPAYLSAPFGRLPKPTPLITRENFVNMRDCGLEEYKMNIEDISDPHFDFKYGFNPLKYIADYLKWWHPSSAEQRREQRAADAIVLHRAMALARQHCGMAEEARLRALMVASGILYGPIATPIDDEGGRHVQVMAMAMQRSGHIIFELSNFSDFSEISNYVEADVDLSGIARAVLSDLQESSTYYVRCCFCSPGVLEAQRAAAIALQKQAELAAANAKRGKKVTTDSLSEDLAGLSVGENELPASDELLVQTSNIFDEKLSVPAVFAGPSTGSFQKSCFVTLPSSIKQVTSEAEAASSPSSPTLRSSRGFASNSSQLIQILDRPLKITAESLSPLRGPPADLQVMQYASGDAVPLDDSCYQVTCLLGDVFCSHAYVSDAVKFFCTGASSCLSPGSNLKRSLTLVGWNDTNHGSLMDLMSEELAYKQYLHDVKKHKKHEAAASSSSSSKDKKSRKDDKTFGQPPPAPVLQRPEATGSFSALTALFPVVSSEGVTRHCHRMVRVGRYVQIYVLDLREGIMGKAQAKWFFESLDGSKAPWKIVLCGSPLGLVAAKAKDFAEAKRQEGKEETEGAVEDMSGLVSSSSLQYVFGNIAKLFMPPPDLSSEEAAQELLGVAQELPVDPDATQQAGPSFEVASEVNLSTREEEEAKLAAPQAPRTLTVQSGILFLSGGTPAPFLAAFNPPGSCADNLPLDEYVAVEIGVGNAHWPAVMQATCQSFDRAPGLGAEFLFGLDESSSVPLSAQAILMVDPMGTSIHIKIMNTTVGDSSGAGSSGLAFELNVKLSEANCVLLPTAGL